ncbi:hypothetical protein NMY22_g9133 [Coprinellus aureogranulatus]|nr:hypothetical protein NMY22_g9133 [Coprinellus aureogranulatus]
MTSIRLPKRAFQQSQHPPQPVKSAPATLRLPNSKTPTSSRLKRSQLPPPGIQYPPSPYEPMVDNDLTITAIENQTGDWDPESDPAHRLSFASWQTFKEFVEGISEEEFFVTPLEGTPGLVFEKVEVEVGEVQTLSVGKDERWRVKEGEERASGESGKGAVVAVEDVEAEPGVTEREKAEVTKSRKEQTDMTTRERRVTRSTPRRQAETDGSGENESLGGAPEMDSREENLVVPPRLRKPRHRSKSPKHKPKSSHTTSVKYYKCRTDMTSLSPHLLNCLPFKNAADLAWFFQSSSEDEIASLINAIREHHTQAFALRHGHVLPRFQRPPNHQRYPPPPFAAAEINRYRLRWKNIEYFRDLLERGNDFGVTQEHRDFLLVEIFDLEEDVKKLTLKWFDFLREYVYEYDELVTWLRLQVPIDTSTAQTPKAVKNKLKRAMKVIRETRETEIEAAVETFSDWADAQYEGMRKMEGVWRKQKLETKRAGCVPRTLKRDRSEVVGGGEVEGQGDDEAAEDTPQRPKKRVKVA